MVCHSLICAPAAFLVWLMCPCLTLARHPFPHPLGCRPSRHPAGPALVTGQDREGRMKHTSFAPTRPDATPQLTLRESVDVAAAHSARAEKCRAMLSPEASGIHHRSAVASPDGIRTRAQLVVLEPIRPQGLPYSST